jgi:hypothetical protein
MTRQSLHFASDEDRQTYQKWMSTLAAVYGSIVVLAIGAVSLRTHPISNAATATVNTIDVAKLTKIDR